MEINNTFYQLPEASTFKTWRNQAPDNFIYAPKAIRYITHMKKLNDPTEPVNNMLERFVLLQEHLGPILFQLPPNQGQDLEKLDDFLNVLPDGHRYAFEFRRKNWFQGETYSLLKKHNCALVIHDFHEQSAPKVLTADWTYLRFHGPRGSYTGRYLEETLQDWSQQFREWLKTDQVKEIYAYFNNDLNAYAVENAKELLTLL